MGKYSKVIKKVEFGWRLAENGWAETYCKNCGWTKNHDIHSDINYKFCPECGGSAEADRFKYEIRNSRKESLVRCEGPYGCGNVLGRYDGESVGVMKFCPYCGNKFKQDYIQRLIDDED